MNRQPIPDAPYESIAPLNRNEQLALTRKSHNGWTCMQVAGALTMAAGVVLDTFDTLGTIPRDCTALSISVLGLAVVRNANRHLREVHIYMDAAEMSHEELSGIM